MSLRTALKRAGRSRTALQAAGRLMAAYLRLVDRTSRWRVDPRDAYDTVERDMPVIIAMWHGQHFIVPFVRRPRHWVGVLISKHRDGEINALAAERLGLATIRGSGAHDRQFLRKGGATALREMVRCLDRGMTIALTADVPKGPARHAGLGIVTLAKISGRPIYPLAGATSRRIELNSWDRAALNLPFSRGVFALGAPVRVPADADDTVLEEARRAVEAGLNEATERAYAIVDGAGAR